MGWFCILDINMGMVLYAGAQGESEEKPWNKLPWVYDRLTFEKGRNLEEIDQVFEAEIPAWQFHKFQTDGLSHDLAVLESDKREPKLVEQFEDVERAIPDASTTGKVRQASKNSE